MDEKEQPQLSAPIKNSATSHPHSAQHRETASTEHTAQSDVAPAKPYTTTQTDRVVPVNSATQTSLVDNATQTIFDHPHIQSLVTASVQPNIPTAAPSNPTANPAAATQTVPVIEPDIDSTDEAYAESTTTSYLTSIASEISKGILENGRLYPSYGKHGYGLPTDDEEMDRLDLQHHKYALVLNNKHFLAPIGPNPQRILDLGTGTGIWALDVADMYPTAQVIGVDIAHIQPAWVAANCQFEIDDIEEPWTYQKSSFDFIHGRDFLYCVRDYPKLLRQCYETLKPGGYVELACILPRAMCDDGSMPPDSAFKTVCDKFYEASVAWGTPTDVPERYAQYMREAGFVDVRENIFKVPSAPWPKDKRLKQIGALELTNVVEGAQAFGLRVFEKVFGWTKEQTDVVMIQFRKDVRNRDYHQYCQYWVVYGRKPSDISTSGAWNG